MSGFHFLELSLSQLLIITYFASLELYFLSDLLPPFILLKWE